MLCIIKILWQTNIAQQTSTCITHTHTHTHTHTYTHHLVQFSSYYIGLLMISTSRVVVVVVVAIVELPKHIIMQFKRGAILVRNSMRIIRILHGVIYIIYIIIYYYVMLFARYARINIHGSTTGRYAARPPSRVFAIDFTTRGCCFLRYFLFGKTSAVLEWLNFANNVRSMCAL